MGFIPAELIKCKRNGELHTKEEIAFLIDQFTQGSLPDYQMAAWLMAVYFKGLSDDEISWLTFHMMHSGKKVKFDHLNDIPVDKHSTGGVGDKTSLILGPIVAAAGVPVPMISGRGLGHTGGTLDKLESIPGFNVNLNLDEFRNQVSSLGLSFIGQTPEICPADKKMYALRDVTGTVESLPLICGSIMSKKIAEGIRGLVLDVKVGSGAFMKTLADAKALAQKLIHIGQSHGVDTAALLTDMNQPLGCHIGNSLEIFECLEILKNQNLIQDGRDLYEDTRILSLELAGLMIWLGKKAKTPEEGLKIAIEKLENGSALKKFEEVCRAQGGDLSRLPTAKNWMIIESKQTGYIQSIETEKIGVAGILMGAGRQKASDKIDPTAGIKIHKKISDYVRVGEPLFTLYAQDPTPFNVAKEILLRGLKISQTPPIKPDLIIQRLIPKT